MTIEAALEANTKALINLAAVMAGAAHIPTPEAVIAKSAAAPATAAPKATAAAAAPKAEAKNDVTYDVVKKAFIALAEAKGRDAAVAAIAPLPTLKEIEAKEQKPGQYKEVLAQIEKAAA